MTTAEIARPSPPSRAAETFAGDGIASSRAGAAMLGVLLLVVLYSAFDHGAVSVSAGARLQVALAAVAAVATAVWLWAGTPRLAFPGLALLGAASLTAFAVWSGVTLVWSVAPNQTWVELNRALTYELVLVLALLAAVGYPRATELVASGALLIVLVVTFYALGQKLTPGIHLSGLFTLNQTQLVPRLEEPFGYWNALGLFVAFGVPIALAVALDRSRGRSLRLVALLSIEPMLLAIALTYSRGALVALAGGLALGIGVGGSRLRALLWLALAGLTTIPPLVFGLASHDLTTVSVSLRAREVAGTELLGLLLASLVVLWFGGVTLVALERRDLVGPQGARRVARALATALAAVLAGALIAIGLSSRGLGGTVSHAWNSFTTTRTPSNYDPARLLSADSANRWVWWKEAARAFGDRPLAGWGAGSFPVLHLLYRRDTLTVQQPHSVPLQFLAETGIVGALLALTAYGSFVATGVRRVRRVTGRDRLLSAALLAGLLAYGIHACYDWDWDIPGVTLPVLVFAGVLAGAGARTSRQGDRLTHAFGPGVRLAALAAGTAVLCAFAISGAVPSIAAGRAATALVEASSSSRAMLERALGSARSATRLDPLSDAGPLASTTIALHLGELHRAREYALVAIQRDPTDVHAWVELAAIEYRLRDVSNWLTALKRAAALDPMGKSTTSLLRFAELVSARSANSAAGRVAPERVTTGALRSPAARP